MDHSNPKMLISFVPFWHRLICSYRFERRQRHHWPLILFVAAEISPPNFRCSRRISCGAFPDWRSPGPADSWLRPDSPPRSDAPDWIFLVWHPTLTTDLEHLNRNITFSGMHIIITRSMQSYRDNNNRNKPNVQRAWVETPWIFPVGTPVYPNGNKNFWPILNASVEFSAQKTPDTYSIFAI